MEIKREHQINFWYIIAAFVGVMLIQNYLMSEPGHTKTIPYSEFQQRVDQGKVTNLVIGPGQITGTFKESEPQAVKPGGPTTAGEGQLQHFITERVPQDLADTLAKKSLSFSGQPGPGILSAVLGWLMPIVGFGLLWIFLIRPMAAGGGGMCGMMAIGKSKAKIFVEKDIKTTFADVAGVDEAKDELKEVVAFLKDPESHGRLGARIPKGVLLVGPPGTGKTLLARAVAGEAGVPFFSISGSEFVEMFVGVGAARVRDLFDQARTKAPAIIFIDELDALGRQRGAGLGNANDEREQTLNQLLVELDGFDASTGLVLLAATNRPEILDPALLRAGRFDRVVLVDRPEKSGRLQILKVHSKKIRLGPDVDLEK